MKVLQIHNNYQIGGGEDVVVVSENRLLSQKNEVISYTVNNTEIVTIYSKLDVALNTSYSLSQKKRLDKYLVEHKPDVVHVHNLFPLLTPSIYDSCIEFGVPVIQTLHNYRSLCANALLMRNHQICERCVTGSPYWATWYGCYRQSRFGSAVVAHSIDYHRRQQTWLRKVDAFIALTDFAKQKFIAGGFPAEKIYIKPNFCESPLITDNHLKERFALFVGRLSPEKGINTLLKAWSTIDYPLTIAGEGDQPIVAADDIKYIGKQSTTEIQGLMQRAQFLVMPSIWFETFGMVIIEAFSNGLPVICSRLGGMAEIVEDGITGLHFEAGNAQDLKAKVEYLLANPALCQEMATNARRCYLDKYTPERNLEQLLTIYNRVLAHKQSA